ncbi:MULTISPECIES: hypothetical protein [unclassified Pseudoalteromonas]|uniref:hypothetical protein n=1 Tax=unclassified Pseudoalteromonas TaxID=194690 RepID=UPI0005A82BA8|nr:MULTISPECIES: hypothetical protein [unclassified Pseudoalteromonas]
MKQNLSVITLLAPMLGYDVSAQIVHTAHHKDISLAKAAELLGLYTSAEFVALLNEKIQQSSTFME